ncbi:hypothetical protein [Anabaena azotica]
MKRESGRGGSLPATEVNINELPAANYKSDCPITNYQLPITNQ